MDTDTEATKRADPVFWTCGKRHRLKSCYHWSRDARRGFNPRDEGVASPELLLPAHPCARLTGDLVVFRPAELRQQLLETRIVSVGVKNPIPK